MQTAHALPGPASRDSVAALLRAALLVAAGAAALAVSAKIQIPHFPVPATLQTFAVLVLGMLAGPKIAAAAVVFYLAQGAAGIPVFAGPVAGPAYFAGPTAGFLLGFLPAAVLAGCCARRGMGAKLHAALAAVLLADAVVFACGIAWLAVFLGDFSKAVALGFVPFVGVESSKAVLAACVVCVASNCARR